MPITLFVCMGSFHECACRQFCILVYIVLSVYHIVLDNIG